MGQSKSTENRFDVNQTDQLLFDDYLVEDVWALRRVVISPTKHPVNPLLVADRQWEDQGIFDPQVFFDEYSDEYRMYYGASNRIAWEYQFTSSLQSQWDKQKHGSSYYMCVAISRDGVNWSKPMFDHVPWREHRQTNIVVDGQTKAQAAKVIRNPAPNDEKRRWLMIYRDRPTPTGPQQRCMAYSADGLKWLADPDNPLVVGAGDGSDSLCWDSDRGQWLSLTRPITFAADTSAVDSPIRRHLRRRISVMTSPDLRRWSYPRTVVFPDELDPAIDCHDMSYVFKHGSHFIAWLDLMDETQGGLTNSQFIWSIDGERWHRLPHRPVVLDRGPAGSWDAGQIRLTRPVIRGDMWFIYYNGTPVGQKVPQWNSTAIGLAVMPRGQLTGYFAGDDDGFLLTRPIRISGRYLEISHGIERFTGPYDDTRLIRVGLLEAPAGGDCHEPAKYLDGFNLDDCQAIRSSFNIAHRVYWNQDCDLSHLIGKIVYLRFHLRNSGIYSFRFTDGDPVNP